MRRTLVTVLLVTFAIGCGKKAPLEPAAEPVASGPEIPGDAASKKFAEKLMNLEISGWAPEDSGEVEFEYTKLTFAPDNSWQAVAYVAIMDERVDCKELGTWTMDPAESATTAGMTWNIEKTTCPGREAGRELRLQMTILGDGSFKVKMR
jgi:predicted small lipoprotein YifL